MSSKTRLANKTQWALKDILDECREVSLNWTKGMERAEKLMDPILLHTFARLRDRLAAIERKANDALAGEYQERA